MILQELRDAVRLQLDRDTEDLPDTLLDLYIREGFQRSIQQEREWPFYATEWAATTEVSTEGQFSFPSDLAGLVEITDSDGHPLIHLGHSMAAASFGAASDIDNTADPAYFSVWGTTVYLWPLPSETATYQIRGYRLPADWVSGGAGAEVDADERLHLPIVHYACSRVYAQDEDEVLQAAYEQSWIAGVGVAREDIMRPQRPTLLVLNSALATPTRRAVSLEV